MRNMMEMGLGYLLALDLGNLWIRLVIFEVCVLYVLL